MKPYVLSVAGFDPSGGAGILADIKAFENTGSYGLGIVSANTVQNDVKFESISPVSDKLILNQLDILKERFSWEYTKIGLVADVSLVLLLGEKLKEMCSDSKIVWDPILKASAGFEFHKVDKGIFKKILENIYLLTPNIPESELIFGTSDPQAIMEQLVDCHNDLNIFLKGGHANTEYSTDYLINKSSVTEYTFTRVEGVGKHGSGCVLSAVLVSFLSQNFSLGEACSKAKGYMNDFIQSTNGLLGYHKIN